MFLVNVQRNLIKELYLPYLYEIDKKKQMLAKYYGIDSLIKKHPAFRDKIDWKIGLEKYIWPINISKILSKMKKNIIVVTHEKEVMQFCDSTISMEDL